MSTRARRNAPRPIRRSRAARRPHNYVLVLYVTGSTPLSMRAVHNLRNLCDQYLAGRHSIEVVDLYRHPERAAASNIVAAPTLVKSKPLPVERFVGDMSDSKAMVARLKIRK